VNHEVLVEPHSVAGASLDRQRDPGVSAHVADLAVLGQVRGNDLVAV
jgi:hypothetical protein